MVCVSVNDPALCDVQSSDERRKPCSKIDDDIIAPPLRFHHQRRRDFSPQTTKAASLHREKNAKQDLLKRTSDCLNMLFVKGSSVLALLSVSQVIAGAALGRQRVLGPDTVRSTEANTMPSGGKEVRKW